MVLQEQNYIRHCTCSQGTWRYDRQAQQPTFWDQRVQRAGVRGVNELSGEQWEDVWVTWLFFCFVTVCRYQPPNMAPLWDYSPCKDHKTLLGIDSVTWFNNCEKTVAKWNKRCSRRPKIMSEMTVLLILVWDTSVNTSIMVLHAVHVPFKCCRDGREHFSTDGNHTRHYISTFLSVPPPSSTVVVKPIKGNAVEALHAET